MFLQGFVGHGECNCEETLREANDGEYSEDWECASDCASLATFIDGPFTQADVDSFNDDNSDMPMCDDCAKELLDSRRVETWESDQGFVYSSLS